MASFTSDSLILVTGANVHVAQHVVDQALRHPARPRIRATVRSAASVDVIKSYWAEYVNEGRLEVVRVPDITADGAFDDAVKGSPSKLSLAIPISDLKATHEGVTHIAYDVSFTNRRPASDDDPHRFTGTLRHPSSSTRRTSRTIC